GRSEAMMQTVILGNFITMDDKRPFAKAALVKDGVFAYIGEAEDVKRLADADAKVLDYGENYIYPGFLESHTHGCLAGYRAIGQADLSKIVPTDYNKYREVIKEFMAKHPEKDIYLAAGWNENDEYITKSYLDEICSDRPLIMNTGGGHSILCNTKALEWAGIDKAFAEKYGPAMVHVDENGEPDGYVCENPAIELFGRLPVSFEDAKTYLLGWQDIALRNGFVGVADAGADIFFKEASKAYHELEEEGKLKMRTYSYIMISDNTDDPKGDIARIAAERVKYSGEYYYIVGAKAFIDGVTEAHTGWQNQDYLDQPGYHGVERFNDHDKMVELIVAADKEGMGVHTHTEGGGAAHFMLGCIEDAVKITGNRHQNNVLAHLHFVTDEDIHRMADTGSVPAVPPLWTPKDNDVYPQEIKFVGQELSDQSYPIKSFYDAGANVAFHSDYPVSPAISVPQSIYMAETRASVGQPETARNLEEAITREQSLKAMTINVARIWHQEHRMGSIEFGKLANMTVSDCDFLHDDIE
ncbi:MAG: amidohydrolase, partial [Lachnospiraceae bacterium]|nr:amidohydrolase [Lachnospiraceae bacterium]